MTPDNIDTEALRAAIKRGMEGHHSEYVDAMSKVWIAAPALLATVEAQRKEIERLNAGWQECLDALAIARNTLAAGADERDALRSTVQQRTEQRDALKAEVENWKSLFDGLERINVETRAQRDESRRKLSASEAEVERLRAALAKAHADLGADGGVAEMECACDDCAALRGEEAPRE